MKRHTCIVCLAKRDEAYMLFVNDVGWCCSKPKDYWQTFNCSEHNDVELVREIKALVRKLEKIKPTYINLNNV